MKINFKHPISKKPSSVILPDIWLKPWFLATHTVSSDVHQYVVRLSQDYYIDRCSACKLVGFVPTSFTQYCQAIMAMAVYDDLQFTSRV
jgi:hypothetical protein